MRWCKKRSIFKLIILVCLVTLFKLGTLVYQQWATNQLSDFQLKRSLNLQEYHRGRESFPNRAEVRYEQRRKPNKTWIHHPWIPSLRGSLNVHVWLDWCGSTVNDLRRSIHFPKFPDVRMQTSLFHVMHDAHQYGQRVFGYLHPPKTGFYTFAISSDDSSELWLSTDDHPVNTQIIAWVGSRNDPLWNGRTGNREFYKYMSQISKPVFLHVEKHYFIEVLHKQSTGNDHVLVAWQIPGMRNFTYITSKRLSQYIYPSELHNLDVASYSLHVPLTAATYEPVVLPITLTDQLPKVNKQYLRTVYKQKTTSIASKLYKMCPYKPSYSIDFKVKRYEGVYLVHETAVFPEDNTYLGYMERYKVCTQTRFTDSHGNYLNNYDNNVGAPVPLVDSDAQDIKANISRILLWLPRVNKKTTKISIQSKKVRSQRNKFPGQTTKDEKPMSFSNRKILAFKRIADERLLLSNTKSFPTISNKITKVAKNRKSKKKSTHLTAVKKSSKGKEKRSIDNSGRRTGRDVTMDRRREPIQSIYVIDNHNNRIIVENVGYNGGNDMDQRGYRERSNNWQREDRALSYYVRLAVDKIKKLGEWDQFKKFSKDNNVLLTKRTMRYALWKYLHHKPKRDKVVEYIYKQNVATCRTDGNLPLNKDVARAVVLNYLKDLRKYYKRDFQLKHVVNVEENHDVFKGDRYLIEVDIQFTDQGLDKTVRFSDYVYLPSGTESFCFPENFAWQHSATVHVIVPVKDQGKWVQHFINDMSELYEETSDPCLNVIIVDFNSTDIDIEGAFARSSLKRYKLLKANGSFQRALGIQLGADIINNPNDIVFTMDLHLEIPNNMIDIARKHCVQGKMAFSPVVMRLDCGFTPSLPFGEWENIGYGIFAIYKSDFDRIGGMNHKEFTTKWGGEDWELVDRCLQSGMEIERLRVPYFYHFYHTKNGLWGSLDFQDISAENSNIILEDQQVPVYDRDEDSSYQYYDNEPLSP